MAETKFEHTDNLSAAQKTELARIQAIPSGQRTAAETAFLNALLPYTITEVVLKDANGLYVIAAGNNLPTGYKNFKKGCTFIKKNAAGAGNYINVGDETSATWQQVTSS